MKYVLIFFLLCSCSTKTTYPVDSETQSSPHTNIKPSPLIKAQPPKNHYPKKNNNTESDKHKDSLKRIDQLNKGIDTGNDRIKILINKADIIIESPTKK